MRPEYGHECGVCYDLLGELFSGERQQLPDFIEDFRGVGNEVAVG